LEPDSKQGGACAERLVQVYRDIFFNAFFTVKRSIGALEVAKGEQVSVLLDLGMIPGNEVIVWEMRRVIACSTNRNGKLRTLDSPAVFGTIHDFDHKQIFPL
jgi:hypothetical protein